jgi:uncharacterized damage-inducible protein DinB
MSIHPLVLQLKFTRNEFRRALQDLSEEDATKRILPMNCISWNVGHLAWQEQRYFLYFGQGLIPYPDIQKAYAYGAPASTPSLVEVLDYWGNITEAADPWIESLTSEKLLEHFMKKDSSQGGTIFGSLLQRVIYHYWYHTGENMAIRQMLGHSHLPEFVGNIDDKAPYVREME